MKTNMKTKKIIMEQTTVPEELKKFFLIPGCFDSKTASVEQVIIGGKNTFAIKKESVKNPGTFIYYTSNGNKYSGSPQNLVIMDSKWSCQGNVQTMQASPAVEYFNEIGFDLNVPDQVQELNTLIDEINAIIANGGVSQSFAKFVSAIREIKNDPKYAQYKDVDNQTIKAVNFTIPNEIKTSYTELFNRAWSPYRNPSADEIGSFEEVTIPIGNKGKKITYYVWQGSQSSAPSLTGKTTLYNVSACTNNLINYVQLIASPETKPSPNRLRTMKNGILGCYSRFWNGATLNDEDITGSIKLGLRNRDKEKVEKLIKYLMNKRDDTGIAFSDQSQSAMRVQYESLQKRLRRALLESIELKKKL